RAGVPTVVAMRHRLPGRGARALAETFFGALCHGDPVREALRAGCAALQREAWAAGEAGQGLLDDWFVPMLFLQRDGLRLCQAPVAPGSLQDWRDGLRQRLGEVPDAPAAGFVGRGPELLALQRLLHAGRHAVLNGPAGVGKTALAAEFAAWMLRCGRMQRAAFVTVAVHDSAADVLERLGRQLAPGFELARFLDLTQARQEVERTLAQAPTLLVLDQMEALQPSALPGAPLARAAEEAAGAILSLCRRLLRQPGTRLLLTSRAALAAPFDDPLQRLELRGLDVDSGLQLLARLLQREAGGAVVDASHEAVEALVRAARGHAWLLGQLAPTLLLWGPQIASAQVLHKLAVAEECFPGSGEAPMLAGLELCLERLPPDVLERARVLGMFHGGFHPEVLQSLMGWTAGEVAALVAQLSDAGLATHASFGHVLLLPALVPALRARLDEAEREALLPLWGAALSEHAGVLLRQQREHPQRATALTLLALPDWLAMLEAAERGAPPAAVVDVANLLIALLRPLRRPGLLAQLLLWRDAALGRARPESQAQAQAQAQAGLSWDAARLGAERARIEGLVVGGRGAEALDAACLLLGQARAAGVQPDAGVELARVCLLGAQAARALKRTREGLPLLEEACARLARAPSDHRLAAACWAERGEGLCELGRLDEAAQAYRSSIQAAQAAGDPRQVAIGQGQLGNLCLRQERWAEALAALDAARRGFEQLGDARAVAAVCYQVGLVQLKAGQPVEAEAAWREALERQTRLHDALGQALTLNQLGVLYEEHLGRAEEALGCFRQGEQCAGHGGNPAVRSLLRGNAADCLRRLGRLDEARAEASAALQDAVQAGATAQPWARWALLASIEQAAGHAAAAERARREAASAYLAWRRAGGEAHDGNAQLGTAVGQALRDGDRAQAEAVLQELAADPRLPAEDRVYVRMLQVIVSGSRDRTLADTPGLHYTAAAEVALLLEGLEGSAG
ncbi:tetratricopeptide repeat protein, partial [uncultured Azohydromonas sp.]|uniref:tetratricopeptide repeat protein n=1 Tax=uncultured Azohydromonas sp. TaxID=487342 RepID=UPI00261C0477